MPKKCILGGMYPKYVRVSSGETIKCCGKIKNWYIGMVLSGLN